MKIVFTIIFSVLFSFLSLCQNDTIIVSGDYNYPPFSFIDKNGKAAGYDIDVMNAIAEITGLNIKFKLSSWDSTLLKLKNGEVDVVTSIVYYAEREKIYDYSFPLHTEYYGIFAKKTTTIDDINDLEKKKPAILDGDISIDLFFTPLGLYKNHTTTKSFPDAFSLVNSGECDYVVAPYSLGMQVIEEQGMRDIVVKGSPIIPSVFCFAVKENNYELLAWINQGLEILSRNGELDRIYNKWVKYKRNDDQYKEFFYYTLIGLLIFAGIIILLFLFWYSLRKQVRKKTQEIRKREILYENVFNSVDDGLILLDNSLIIIEANKRAYSLFSYKNGILIGENVLSLIRDEYKEKLADVIDLVKLNQPFFAENIKRELDGEIQYISLKGFQTDPDDKKRYLIVIHDITRERINYLNLQETKKNADAANIAKSAFLSTISHEIRTPLFAVIGFTELMDKTPLSKQQQDYNKKIALSGKLLLNLVNDILDLNKLEAEKIILTPEPFNIYELIEEICEVESVNTTEKNIKLVYEIGENVPPFVIGDKMYLSRIIINIMNNALKFTDQGQVTLLVNVENIGKLTNVDVVNLIFSIKDTGIGMSTESQNKLFSPFVQIQNTQDRKYGGTGLGLAISKQLAELMNGEIMVESTEGKGSVFNVSIPLKIAHEKQIEDKKEITEIKSDEVISVLLVEDNEFNAEILLNQLNDANFKVVHAKSGFDALEILKTNSFGIILMDIEMPGMDGFATLEKIRNQHLSDAPIVALSAHNLSSEKEKAIQAGMVDYLNKPISIKELSLAIYKYSANEKNVEKKEQPAIDHKEGLAFFDNNNESYQRALVRFKKHFNALPEKLMEYFNEDFSQLKDHTHNLKSAAKTIGATELSNVAQNNDEMLRSHPDDFTINELQILIQALEKVLNEIGPIDGN